jgi:hypothetical protein
MKHSYYDSPSLEADFVYHDQNIHLVNELRRVVQELAERYDRATIQANLLPPIEKVSLQEICEHFNKLAINHWVGPERLFFIAVMFCMRLRDMNENLE